MKKICTWCKAEKDESEFYFKNTPKRHAHCIKCANEKSRQHYQKNPTMYAEKAKQSRIKACQEINKLKDVPCTDCKNKYPVVCMDFDHIGDKIDNVTSLAMRGNIAGALEEAKKCEVVCSNCHRIRTADRLEKRRKARLEGQTGFEPVFTTPLRLEA